MLHGGPGGTHDYLEPYERLAKSGRAVIFYDQLGAGRSTHLRDKEPGFWTVELFLAELDNLLSHLGIEKDYPLVGQSWGGMLGAEHGVLRPAGLRSLVISDSPASMTLWVQEADRLREALPKEVQQTLLKHEAAGTTESPDYTAAVRVFYDRHLCRLDPWPDCMNRSFRYMQEDPTVYHTMNGPSEFHVVGSLKSWSIIDRLHLIEAPTLRFPGAMTRRRRRRVCPIRSPMSAGRSSRNRAIRRILGRATAAGNSSTSFSPRKRDEGTKSSATDARQPNRDERKAIATRTTWLMGAAAPQVDRRKRQPGTRGWSSR